MSAYRCESCGHDGPLSDPCPVCEPSVRNHLEGGFDITKPSILVPLAETRALLSRLDALRLEHAALIEQLAQKNREIQEQGEELSRSCTAIADASSILKRGNLSLANAAQKRMDELATLRSLVKCPCRCSECEGHHHRVEGSDRCKHCNAVLPREELEL